MNQKLSESQRVDSVARAGAGLKILIIEDDTPTARAMRQLLEYHRFHVDIAGSVSEAMQRVGQIAYDYALIDLMLPDGHGSEVYVWLRDNAPGTKATILTGCSDGRIAELLDSIAPAVVMKKPVDFGHLLQRLRAA